MTPTYLPGIDNPATHAIRRLPPGDKLLSAWEYAHLSSCRLELVALSHAVEAGATGDSLRKLIVSATNRALSTPKVGP